MGASGPVSGSLEQTFDTQIGVTYFVNYLLATQEFSKGVVPMQAVLAEALDGNALNSVTTSFNQAAGVWSNGLTIAFVATSAFTTLRFTERTTAENTPLANWALDNVTVDAVPEPSTFVLLGAGLVLVGVCRKQFGQELAQ